MKESIKTFRRAKRMTQKQLAERLGVSISAVGMWELGERNPPAKKLPALAAALGCTIDELFADGPLIEMSATMRGEEG